MHTFCSLLATAALLAVAHGAPQTLTPADERLIAALPVIPPGLNDRDMLEIKPAQTIDATYTHTVRAPNLKATDWVLFTPYPPTSSAQKITSAATTPAGERVAELSVLAQPLLRAIIPANRRALEREVTFKTEIRANLFSRRLVPRTGLNVATVPPLSETERRLFLRRTPAFDYTNPAVRDWMADNKLQRLEKEGEVSVARRTYQSIAKRFKYEYLGAQDRTAANVCSVRKSDCGGMAVLFVTALRAQGIPARTLAGRWAASAKPNDKVGSIDYYQEHVKAEFFAQGIGWVPADLSSGVLHDKTVDKLTYFANDRGDFLTLHFDGGIILDTVYFGEKPMDLLQRPSYWAKGTGDFKGSEITEKWEVTKASGLVPAR